MMSGTSSSGAASVNGRGGEGGTSPLLVLGGNDIGALGAERVIDEPVLYLELVAWATLDAWSWWWRGVVLQRGRQRC